MAGDALIGEGLNQLVEGGTSALLGGAGKVAGAAGKAAIGAGKLGVGATKLGAKGAIGTAKLPVRGAGKVAGAVGRNLASRVYTPDKTAGTTPPGGAPPQSSTNLTGTAPEGQHQAMFGPKNTGTQKKIQGFGSE